MSLTPEQREATRVKSKLYYKNNRTKARAAAIARNAANRAEMLSAYGAKCQCCGEDEPGFLTLDHVNNDGADHRREIGGASLIIAHLKKRGWPKDGYQLLCYNCNCGRHRNGGVCPHHRPRFDLGAPASFPECAAEFCGFG